MKVEDVLFRDEQTDADAESVTELAHGGERGWHDRELFALDVAVDAFRRKIERETLRDATPAQEKRGSTQLDSPAPIEPETGGVIPNRSGVADRRRDGAAGERSLIAVQKRILVAGASRTIRDRDRESHGGDASALHARELITPLQADKRKADLGTADHPTQRKRGRAIR